MGQSPVYDFKNDHYQLSKLAKVADSNACQKEWSILNKQFATVKLLERTCVSSAYAYWLSTQALHLPVSTNIVFEKENINNSWTKGSVIMRYMPSSYNND
jgi:hypothetical protein